MGLIHFKNTYISKLKMFFGVLTLLCCLPLSVYSATTYNFESDTVGTTPANVTVTAGTFEVQNQVTLGKSLTAVTQLGVISGAVFNNFTGSADQSVVWKQAYSNNMGRGGFTLRAQNTDTSVSVGAKQGYLFHVYDNSSVYIWKVGPSSYTALWSGSLVKAEPRWFKAMVVGNQQGFYYSNDGVSYTLLASTTDATYATGTVQYTAGYGLAVSRDYVDDIVITNLDFDGTAPTVSTLSPTDGATNVATSANLVMTFDENVDTETGYVRIYKTSDDSIVETIDVAGGQVTGSGTNVITINPNTTLSGLTGYYVQVDATAFDDTAGNSFAGITSSSTWNFTTLDTTTLPPTLATPLAGTYTNTTPLTVSFILPEAAYPSSISLTFTPSIGTPIVLHLRDALDSQLNTFSLPLTGGISSTVEVLSTNSDTIPVGTYTVSLSYQDASGNAASSASVSGVVVQAPVILSEQQPSLGAWSGPTGGSSGGSTSYSAPTTVTTIVTVPTVTTVDSSIYTFTRTLVLNSTHSEVKTLQQFLNAHGFTVAKVGAGSPGFETTKFGPATKAALIRFQKANKITPALGFFGPATRKVIEEMN